MIFILVPPVFCIRRAELSHAHAQQKMTTPSRRTCARAMAFILTSVEVSLELYLLCEKHDGSLSEKAPTEPIYVKIMVPSCVVHELSFEEEEDGEIVNLAESRMDCLRGCLATLSVLVVRIALLEYSKIHEVKCIVCEFGGFQNVLRDACVRAIPT